MTVILAGAQSGLTFATQYALWYERGCREVSIWNDREDAHEDIEMPIGMSAKQMSVLFGIPLYFDQLRSDISLVRR